MGSTSIDTEGQLYLKVDCDTLKMNTLNLKVDSKEKMELYNTKRRKREHRIKRKQHNRVKPNHINNQV